MPYKSYDKATATLLPPFKLLIAKSKEIKEVWKQMENQQRAASNDNVSLDPAPNDHAVEAPPFRTGLNQERSAQSAATRFTGLVGARYTRGLAIIVGKRNKI
jgi:hypothetical protein